jgi:putative membrane protein
MKLVYTVVFVVVFVIALLFSYKNLQPVTVHLVVGAIQLPLAVALTVELLVGVALGIAVCFTYLLRLKSECGRLQTRLQAAELEIQSLQALAAEKTS